MTVCQGCGKAFDYEKYYGICPKCGTYNQKDAAQEIHLKSQPVKWFLMAVLVTGILLAGFWFKSALTLFLSGDSEVRAEQTETVNYSNESAGEEFVLTAAGSRITVRSAETVIPENSGKEGFPRQEKLVAVEVRYTSTGEYGFEGEYDPLEPPYVRYLDSDGQFICKETLSDYSFEGREDHGAYGDLLDVFDLFLFRAEDKTGVYLFFVNSEASELDFCISEWDTESGELMVIHDVPLEIEEE